MANPRLSLPGDHRDGLPHGTRGRLQHGNRTGVPARARLTEPDPVDVRHLERRLPSTARDEVDVSDTDYDTDIRRTTGATDSKGQREKLLGALRETPFVMTVDTGRTNEYVSKPGKRYYLATDRLRSCCGRTRRAAVDDRYAAAW